MTADPVAGFGLPSDGHEASTTKTSILLPAPYLLTLGISPPGQGPRYSFN